VKSYIFGEKHNFDLNKYFFKSDSVGDRVIQFSDFSSYIRFISFFPIMQYEPERDHSL